MLKDPRWSGASLSRERPRIEYANDVVELKIGSRIPDLDLSRSSR
jgi:hypothetical protein